MALVSERPFLRLGCVHGLRMCMCIDGVLHVSDVWHVWSIICGMCNVYSTCVVHVVS